MKKQVIENKLIKLGYTVVYTYEGNVIAYKGQRTYKSASLNGLYKIIFKQLYKISNMKAKVTKKQVMSYNSNILEVGYCGLQSLLSRFSPQYYTCGVYGWNADIYEIDGVYICTGYRPFGNIKFDYKELDRVNKEYEVIKENHLPYDEETKEVKRLLKSLFTK